MGRIQSDLTKPEFIRFLEALPAPDDEFSALSVELAALEPKRQRLAAREQEVRQRLATIDPALVDIDDPEQYTKLLQERGTLEQAEASLPGQRAEIDRRHCLARLRWLARLRILAIAEVRRLDAELATPLEAAREITKMVSHADQVKGSHGTGDLSSDRLAELARDRAKIREQTQTARDQRYLAEQIVTVAEATAQMAYGATVRLDVTGTWDDALARVAGRGRPPVVRSWPHASHGG